jgi:hypothetical protein
MKILFHLLFTSLSLFAIAQKEGKKATNPDKLGFVYSDLIEERTASTGIHLPFSAIKIIDSRFDTSKLGFKPIESTNLSVMTTFKKISIRGGIAKSIENFYNDYYKNSFNQNDFVLLIVMKKFWISGIDNSKGNRIDFTEYSETAANFYCKWEYYLGKGDRYLPIKRIDTIIKANEDGFKYYEGGLKGSKLEYFKSILKSLIEIFDFEKAIVAYESQPKKTLTEVHAYNNKRNFLPILQDSVVKRGVYLNFNDFINNKPTIVSFIEKKMNYGNAGITKEQYLETPSGESISEYWGYSDGKVLRYGKFGNELIFRVGNTFEFFIVRKRTEGSGTSNYSRTPYQLNMETGEPY